MYKYKLIRLIKILIDKYVQINYNTLNQII